MAKAKNPQRSSIARLVRGMGLRSLERARPYAISRGLERLNEVLGRRGGSMTSSTHMRPVHGPAGPVPSFDFDDPHADPRFFEPKAYLPSERATFLRAIAVRAGQLFLAWDVDGATRASLRGPVEVALFGSAFLGEPPSPASLLEVPPLAVVDVDLVSGGWYVAVPLARLAVVAALRVRESPPRVLAHSNVALLVPLGPAPAGPLWMASIPLDVDRRRLAPGMLASALLRGGEAPDGVEVETLGTSEPVVTDAADAPTSAGAWSGASPSLRGAAGPKKAL